MTRTPRCWLVRLMVALLLWQGATSAAHCLSMLGQGAGVPICTADGIRIAQPGQNRDPAAHHGGDGCVACHSLPQGPVPFVPQVSAPVWSLAGGLPPAPPALGRPMPDGALPYAARAPPRA
jgi:hypothetical protein